jgi:transcriptional regulator with XRE-family HTH domain
MNEHVDSEPPRFDMNRAEVQRVTADLRKWSESHKGLPREEFAEVSELALAAEVALERFSGWAEHLGPYDAEDFDYAGDDSVALHAALHMVHARCRTATLLASYREIAGMSLRGLSGFVGLSHTLLGQIERCAVRLPSQESMPLLVELLESPLWPEERGRDAELRASGKGERYVAMRALRKALASVPPHLLPAISPVLVGVISLLTKAAVEAGTHSPSTRTNDVNQVSEQGPPARKSQPSRRRSSRGNHRRE